jgi:hypothetical protein
VIEQGELEEACSLGRQAIALVGRLKSRRSTNHLKDLTRRLEPYRQELPVKEFRELALTLMRAV